MSAQTNSMSPSFALSIESAFGTLPGVAPQVLVDDASLRIVEEPFLRIVSVRASRKGDIAIRQQWPIPSALSPNTFEGTSAQSVARFEPLAWMLIGDGGMETPASIDGCLVTDLSSRLTAFRITGPAAVDVLASSAGVHPRPGGFLRTLFAESYAVLLQGFDDADFRLLVDVSLARACADWLIDAATLVRTG
jgi:sarcosine oxidase gamma subunit